MTDDRATITLDKTLDYEAEIERLKGELHAAYEGLRVMLPALTRSVLYSK